MNNITSVLHCMPERTQNNRILYYFPTVTYALAQTAQYLSMAVAVLSVLLFAAGYFGAKLQALEAVAVVQISALLLFTADNTGPTYNGLQYLGWSLGATPFLRSTYFYESASLPYPVRSMVSSSDSISTYNIFLLVLVVPLLAALIFKVISGADSSGKKSKLWKYTLGSYTFYGLMFLAYGELSILVLNVRRY